MSKPLPLFHPDLAVQLAHTEQQIAACAEAAQNADLSESERRGACLGWADWLDNQASIEEEIARC